MRDSKPFLKMLREDGDFQGYCGVKFSEKNLSKFATYFERTGQEECIYSVFQKDSMEKFIGYPEYRLVSIIYDSIMVFAKDTDNYLTMEYYGGNEGKIIFYMDVQTGNILENDKNRKEEIYYLQSTLRAWYNDMREKLLEGYQNGRFTILPEWDE